MKKDIEVTLENTIEDIIVNKISYNPKLNFDTSTSPLEVLKKFRKGY